MLVVADHLCVEALLEEMADTLVSLVEPLRVDAVEAVHTGGDVVELGLDDQVEVIVEQAVGEDCPAEARGRVGEEAHPAPPIHVVDDDRHPRDAAHGEVEDAGGGKNATRQARHGRHRTVPARAQRAVALTFYRHVTGTVP
jgi:hypothetical protein